MVHFVKIKHFRRHWRVFKNYYYNKASCSLASCYFDSPKPVTYTWWKRWCWPTLLQKAHVPCWPAEAVCSWSEAGQSAGESRSWLEAGHCRREQVCHIGHTGASPFWHCRWPQHRTPRSSQRRWSSQKARWGTTTILLYSGKQVRGIDIPNYFRGFQQQI